MPNITLLSIPIDLIVIDFVYWIIIDFFFCDLDFYRFPILIDFDRRIKSINNADID